MHTVLVASNNAHKLQELREIIALAGASDAIRLITPNDLALSLDPAETADTYAGNALLKARAFAVALHTPSPSPSPLGRGGLFVLADDSGLEVDALGGRPGIYSARYHKAAPSGDGCAALLAEMKDVPEGQRAARFRCLIALITPGGAEHVFDGVCEGHIGHEKRGRNGFGFDPVFVVAGDAPARTMAELSPEEKHRVSHRGMAGKEVAAFLRHTPCHSYNRPMSEMNQPPRGSDQALDMVYVKRIKAKYEASLMQHPHVVGVGIGLTQTASTSTERSLTLVVNVDSEVAVSDLPKELEGVPVTVKTTGEFKAL